MTESWNCKRSMTASLEKTRAHRRMSAGLMRTSSSWSPSVFRLTRKITRRWNGSGGSFDPVAFSVDDINERLSFIKA